MQTRLEWLFFDLGSTLVDESGALARRVRDTVAGSQVTCGQFHEKMRAFAVENKKGYQAAARFFGLDKAPWYPEEERLYPEARALLEALSGRYRLGVIANQLPGARARLERWGILAYFGVVVTSAEEGVEKPDLEIFRRALRRAGCAPVHAAMIGDRLDNDIAPAKALGMAAIWVRQGMAALARPSEAGARPDIAAESLAELPGVLLSP